MPTATTRRTKGAKPQTEAAILDGALAVFGEKGFEAATVSAICKAAGISDATFYQYFPSKEDALFEIARVHTSRELERVTEIARYVHPHAERVRLIIQSYLEFYEANPLYTSVALLTLKSNRRFISSASSEPVRASARALVDVVEAGVAAGVFREGLDVYLVRNMVLGFIEHLTIQWLTMKRPDKLAGQRDQVFDMVMRSIAVEPRE